MPTTLGTCELRLTRRYDARPDITTLDPERTLELDSRLAHAGGLGRGGEILTPADGRARIGRDVVLALQAPYAAAGRAS